MQTRVFAVLIALLLTLLTTAADAQNNASLRARALLAAGEQFADKVIELTNIERVRLGVPPLKRQDALCASARWLAGDMVANRYFEHVDRLGRNIDPRFPDFGYRNYAAIGENIAAGQRTPREVVDTWLKSPGHRANLLNADFREVGVSYVYAPNSEYGCYWVQDFGKRADTFPLIINLEAAQTRSPDVKLYIYGDKWAKSMRFSGNGATWTDWEPYRADREWKLNAQAGKQTVFVELNNGVETRRSSATIELVNPTRVATSPVKPLAH
jgi:uncharacterized protein YkwD